VSLTRIIIAGVLLAVGCARAADDRPLVVTSFLPLYCWTANVAGDFARVEQLLPSRAEPHDYAFTPGDARKLNAADLAIVNGLGLEVWLRRWEHADARTRDKVIEIAGGLPPTALIEQGRGTNPHLWLDPLLACAAVSNITAGLQRIDPRHAVDYRQSALAYIARLHRLDADIGETLAGVTNRTIVTYHDAFPYFARRYGLEIAGIVEKVPEVNPTPKYLSRLHEIIRARNVRAIFIAPNSSSRLARQIAEDLGVRLVALDTLEAGAAHPAAYEERLRANAAVLRDTLR